MKGYNDPGDEEYKKFSDQAQTDLYFIKTVLIKQKHLQIDNKPEPFPRIIDKVLVGMIFMAVYAALNCISYGSQVVLVPKLLEAGMLDQLALWYFGSEVSIAYFLNQTGYFFWAIGTLVMFSRFITQKGMIRYISILYVFSAVLSIVAFVGLVINSVILNSMTFPSGLLLLPVGVMTVVWGVKSKQSISSANFN